MRWRNHDKICWIKSKNYLFTSYLLDDSSEDKKTKSTKKCIIKKLKSENYKNCFEATQLENKINHLEKNKNHIDRSNENHKGFIKNNKSILKT